MPSRIVLSGNSKSKSQKGNLLGSVLDSAPNHELPKLITIVWGASGVAAFLAADRGAAAPSTAHCRECTLTSSVYKTPNVRPYNVFKRSCAVLCSRRRSHCDMRSRTMP